jgi:hypothetical protein
MTQAILGNPLFMIKARMQVTAFAYSYDASTPHHLSTGPSCRRIRPRYP